MGVVCSLLFMSPSPYTLYYTHSLPFYIHISQFEHLIWRTLSFSSIPGWDPSESRLAAHRKHVVLILAPLCPQVLSDCATSCLLVGERRARPAEWRLVMVADGGADAAFTTVTIGVIICGWVGRRGSTYLHLMPSHIQYRFERDKSGRLTLNGPIHAVAGLQMRMRAVFKSKSDGLRLWSTKRLLSSWVLFVLILYVCIALHISIFKPNKIWFLQQHAICSEKKQNKYAIWFHKAQLHIVSYKPIKSKMGIHLRELL